MFGLEENEDEKWSTVDAYQTACLWQMFYTTPIVCACQNFIVNKLLGLGLMFTHAEKDMLPSKTFYEHVQKKIVPFAKEIVENIIVQGFVVFAIVPGDGRSHSLPYAVVPPRDTYRVQVNIGKNFRRNIRAVPVGDEHKKEKLFVYVSEFPFGGVISSRSASLWRSYQFMTAVEQTHMYVDGVRANPPVLTTNKTDNTFDTRDVIAGAVPGLAAQNASESIGVRNRINAQQFRQQEELIRTLNANRIDTSSAAWQSKIDPVTGLPSFDGGAPDSYVPAFVPLPNDAEVASMPLPESRINLEATRRHFEQQASHVLGIPLSTLSGGQSFQSNRALEISDDTLRFTLMRYRTIVTDILGDIYKLLYVPLTKKIDDGEIAHFDSSNIIFPSFQRVGDMKTLYSEGILGYESYIRFLKPHFDLEDADINEETELRDYKKRKIDDSKSKGSEKEDTTKKQEFSI